MSLSYIWSPKQECQTDTSRSLRVSVDPEGTRSNVIPMSTRLTAEEVMRLAENLERIVQGNMAESSTAAITENFGEICPTKNEKIALEAILCKAHNLAATNAASNEGKASAP